jgi:hypothetical protein
MIKKLLFIFFLLPLTKTAFTQDLLRTVSMEPISQTEAQIADNSLEIKYCTNKINISLGVAAGAKIEAAIFIPKERANKYAGQMLTKIRVGFGKNAATDTKVFIRTNLDSDPVYTQAATFTVSAWNDITLSEPYEIKPDEDLYIGYSFTSGNGTNIYSLGLDDSPQTNPNGDLIKYKVGTTDYPWEHVGEQNFTNLCIAGIVEGEDLPHHDVDFSSLSVFPLSLVDINEPISITLNAQNIAMDTITSIDIAYKTGEGEKVIQPFTQLNIAPSSTFNLNISNIVFDVAGEYPMEVSIDKINGSDDQYPLDNIQRTTIKVWNNPTEAPTIVSSQPSNKNVVLEEFTGVNCQYCPDGHKRANQIKDSNPERVSVINIHQGSYAYVIPDYRTDWGDAIANQTGLTGYPSGTVNRHVFSGGKTILERGSFATRSTTILAQPSYVNVAARATVNENSRELIVDVELYYTADGSPVNLLNVALLQDSILGPQIGGSTYYPEMFKNGKYQHNHMLRDLLTKQWGDSIRQTSAGTFVAKRYVYDIPEAYREIPVNLDKLEIVAFVAEGKQEIVSGNSSKVAKSSDTGNIGNIKEGIVVASIHDGSLYFRSETPVQNVNLYNISGQKILTATSGKTIDVSHLNAGIYIVKLQTAEGEKVIKINK